jgi:amidase
MEMSATAVAARVRSGDVSAREAVEASLRAIERDDGEIGAFVALAGERALAEADRVRPGDPRPLCGVPVGIKDLITPTAGLPATHGSAAFGDWVADRDAPHVQRLRAAGAIVIGRTNTPELGLRPVTEPVRHGPTRNPRDLRLSAGGSSGGSAAAVAAGLVPLCDGSDAGGSIRIPAACCGVVGLKPSRGLVPFPTGFDDPAHSPIVFGPIARTVRDAAVALDAMAGTGRFGAAAGRPPGRLPLRVALSGPLGVPVDDAPRTAAERAASVLAALGHEVREQAPEWDDERFPGAWATIGAWSMRRIVRQIEEAHGRPLDPAALEPASRAWLVDGPPVTDAQHDEAIAALRAFTDAMLENWPEDVVLLTPTLTRLPVEAGRLRSQAGVSVDGVRFSAFLRIFNVTGQPAITVPVGDTTGVQLVARPGRDDLVLALAAQLEQALG